MLVSDPAAILLPRANREAFLQLNQEAYQQLITFLAIAPKRLTIGFVAIDFQRDQSILLELLRQDNRCQDLQIEVFCLDDPDLRFVQDELRQELPQRSQIPGKKLIVFLTGLEKSIGLYGSYPVVLENLNFVRDSLVYSIPHPLVICVPNSVLTRIARYAPDFWDWKRAVIEFRTLPHTLAFQDVEKRQQTLADQNNNNKKIQIEFLLQLLTCSENSELTPAIRYAYLQLWQQVGKLYADLDENHLAEDAFQKSLGLAKTIGTVIEQADILGDLATLRFTQGNNLAAWQLWQEVLSLARGIDRRIEAKALDGMGHIKNHQGFPQEALALWENSLAISQEIQDLKGEALILCAIAELKKTQGSINAAIQLWEKSLAISQHIKALSIQTTAMEGLADIAYLQGEIDRSLELYNKSLQARTLIGDAQEKAAIFHQMAIQGQVDQALCLYQQSLQINESIGNDQGKAATLHQMAIIYANQGQSDQALALYQQSLQINESIGNDQGKAATLHQMAIIYANQDQIEQALALYQQSLKINESIGNAQGKAATLAMMGQLWASQQEFTAAIGALEESVAILQRIHAHEVSKVEEILQKIRLSAML
jgi:tetratricopeptide (TPR) repeat protein